MVQSVPDFHLLTLAMDGLMMQRNTGRCWCESCRFGQTEI